MWSPETESKEGRASREIETRSKLINSLSLYIVRCRLQGNFLFTYTIRFRLVEDSPYESVRLTSRRWEIQNGPQVQVVEGPGVVGLYPVLRRGEAAFSYQSW